MKENKIGMLKKGISLKDVSVSIDNKSDSSSIPTLSLKLEKSMQLWEVPVVGKSTLINTIMGGFSPVQGEVLFDGIDSREI